MRCHSSFTQTIRLMKFSGWRALNAKRLADNLNFPINRPDLEYLRSHNQSQSIHVFHVILLNVDIHRENKRRAKCTAMINGFEWHACSFLTVTANKLTLLKVPGQIRMKMYASWCGIADALYEPQLILVHFK